MNTMRRLLFTVLVVALLVGALAMPMSASAAGPKGQTKSMVVTCGVDAALNIGPVLVRIPGDATAELGECTFALTMSVTGLPNGYEVEILTSADYSGKGALLSFGPRVVGATSLEDDAPLLPTDPALWRGNQPAFELDHFSRYSGWF